jgi:hypothetical protein
MPDEDEIAVLREYAARAREVAKVISNQEAADGLLRYAEQQEAKADELEDMPVLPPAAAIPSGEPPIARAGAALKSEIPPESAPGPSHDPAGAKPEDSTETTEKSGPPVEG